MSEHAIQVSHVVKTYEIGSTEAYKTLRDTISNVVKAPFRRRKAVPTMNALDDVSLEFERGAVVGLIGRNGAGKSTLLKVMSRITEPTSGWIEMRGRVGSLLEVGTGFHPELTGRENIFLNGAILGMRRHEILRRFDEIVAFAELDKFIDTQVKHYSSGMYMRLAFSVAAHLEPDILLVDEVLAVGDAEFQRKCIGKMSELPNSGRTVILVSHSMTAVTGLCQQVVWIEKGRVKERGEPDQVIRNYLGSLASGELTFAVHRDVHVKSVLLRDKHGSPETTFAPGDPLEVVVQYDSTKRHETVYFRVIISSPSGYLFGADMLFDGSLPAIDGEQTIACRFNALPLIPGIYTVQLAILDRSGRHPLFQMQEVSSFHVVGNLHDFGLRGELANTVRVKASPVVIDYEWRLPDGEIRKVVTKGRQDDAKR